MRKILFLLAVAVALDECVEAQTWRIEEASFVKIGGIEQWVTIRGDDKRKPVLLLLHGGPGDVQSPFISTYAPYEKDFVLVQWDQRGAGRTFAKNGTAGVTLRETHRRRDRSRRTAAPALSSGDADPVRPFLGQHHRDRHGAAAAGTVRRIRRHGPGHRLGRLGAVPVRLPQAALQGTGRHDRARRSRGHRHAGPEERPAVFPLLAPDPPEHECRRIRPGSPA